MDVLDDNDGLVAMGTAIDGLPEFLPMISSVTPGHGKTAARATPGTVSGRTGLIAASARYDRDRLAIEASRHERDPRVMKWWARSRADARVQKTGRLQHFRSVQCVHNGTDAVLVMSYP
jgi:hypothetical protein